MKRWDPALPLRVAAAFPAAILEVVRGTRISLGEGNADAIILLGATVLPSGQASGSLRARAEAAARLFHAGRAPLVVATGAHHRQPPGEAVVAREILWAAGVPESAVLIEEKSRNTHGNLLFARALVPDAVRILLVTEPFHMARALYLARVNGFSEVIPHPVQSPAWNRPLDRIRLTTRDCFSMAITLGEHTLRAPE
jgi:uncharacterized SAM-binding protein YcdF (DUF218 family)